MLQVVGLVGEVEQVRLGPVMADPLPHGEPEPGGFLLFPVPQFPEPVRSHPP